MENNCSALRKGNSDRNSCELFDRDPITLLSTAAYSKGTRHVSTHLPGGNNIEEKDFEKMDMLAASEIKEKGLLLPRCSFCGKVPAEGIHGGLKLKRLFVCRECERLILTLEVGTPAYDDLMKKIKGLFRL